MDEAAAVADGEWDRGTCEAIDGIRAWTRQMVAKSPVEGSLLMNHLEAITITPGDWIGGEVSAGEVRVLFGCQQ